MRLTKGAVGRIAMIHFMAPILAIITAYGLKSGLAFLLVTLHYPSTIVTGRAGLYILNTLIKIALGPISAIGITLAYYDQRVRKEAFDIEHMIQLMGHPAPPTVDGASVPPSQ
jgi:hypothetical protein